MHQDITPGSAPAFPIHSVCRPSGSQLKISAQTSNLQQCYSTTHSYRTSSPVLALRISTSLSSVRPVCSLIWSHFFDPPQEHWSSSHTEASLIPTEVWQRLCRNKGMFKRGVKSTQTIFFAKALSYLFSCLSIWLSWGRILLLFLK